MSVSNGDRADEDTFNGKLASKTANNSFAGIQDLNNGSSGPQISNAQLQINYSKATASNNVSLEDNGTLVLDTYSMNQIFTISGAGGAVAISDTPFGTPLAIQDGTSVELICTSDSNTVKLISNDIADGMLLDGAKILCKGESVRLRYSSTMARWIEI